MAKVRSLKISISGVRGIVGDTLTPPLLIRFAQSFGTYANGGTVVVGRDTRVSGEMVKCAVFSGLISTGSQVIDCGVCPVPSLQVMVRRLNADGGIMITASHNPIEWNALKFFQPDGTYLNSQQAEELLDIYHQGEFIRAAWKGYLPVRIEENVFQHHLDIIKDFVDVDVIRAKKFRVAIDCCNGAGSIVTSQLLKELGCDVVAINDIPNGIFPHNPEPIPENLTELCKLVKEKKVDIGFAQDADADRLAIINETGEPLGEEYTLALVTQAVIKRKPGTVVANLSTTRALDDVAKMYNAQIVRSKVGEINVVETMKKVGAVVGGEGNGGVIIPEINYGRDSFGGIAIVLQHLAESGQTISGLVKTIPQYIMIKTKISCPSDKMFSILRKIAELYKNENLNLEDGVKINFPDSWLHIRASNTEPIIRIIAESKTKQQAESLCDKIKQQIAEM